MKEWEMIEFTYDCMRGKIRELQDDIDQGYLDDDEIKETLDDMDYYYEAIIFMYNYNTITDAMKKMETVIVL